MPTHHFTAELWLWDARAEQRWTFVTVPAEVSAGIRDEAEAHGPPRGFGSVRVEVTLGQSQWRTSVFPDSKSGCYVLPIKKAVRKAERLDVGDDASLQLELI